MLNAKIVHCLRVNSDIPKLITPNDLEKNSSLQVHYQVQHLVGHWQEILRPPKT